MTTKLWLVIMTTKLWPVIRHIRWFFAIDVVSKYYAMMDRADVHVTSEEVTRAYAVCDAIWRGEA
jgi:hypothetical protein